MGEDKGREEMGNGDNFYVAVTNKAGKRGANPEEASLTGGGNSLGKIIYIS